MFLEFRQPRSRTTSSSGCFLRRYHLIQVQNEQRRQATHSLSIACYFIQKFDIPIHLCSHESVIGIFALLYYSHHTSNSAKRFTGTPLALSPTLIFPGSYSISPILSLNPLDARWIRLHFKLIVQVPFSWLKIPETNWMCPALAKSYNSLQTGLTTAQASLSFNSLLKHPDSHVIHRLRYPSA